MRTDIMSLVDLAKVKAKTVSFGLSWQGSEWNYQMSSLQQVWQ